MGAKIENIAYYLPEGKLDSAALKEIFPDFDINKIEDKVGIKSRHIAGEKETSLDLAYKASLNVIERSGTNDIDFIILCTQTPDYILPTGACILQDRLGLPSSIGALDFNLGCSGYVYGLAMCKGFLEASIASKILFVTADTYTKYIHKKDKGNRSIFGDAATATIITKDEKDKLGQFNLGSDGSGFDKLIIKNGGGKNEFDEKAEIKNYGDGNQFTDNCIYMNGPEIFNFTINNIPKLISDTLKANKLKKEDVDYFVFHQANKFMLNYLRRKIGIPLEKFHIDLEKTGNTVSSTIPIALHQALENEKIKKGNKVLLAGFGVGLSWGATIIEI
ncbi:ketoacyl-ACP synthase III [Arenibacter sp. F26102]|uniref:3-oxoacyl-ACP synthase III family protein n=1 Tax=Arenibacter sp. F26102 TaxID=2926416 RepID=UPI001FF3D5F3|nr:ketoacyl-ACP synthase III [Arenibacter sp. F26102]MCK0144110.1 ketoacyl-ACP synthase III [Arenibacter sp. F26102]